MERTADPYKKPNLPAIFATLTISERTFYNVVYHLLRHIYFNISYHIHFAEKQGKSFKMIHQIYLVFFAIWDR